MAQNSIVTLYFDTEKESVQIAQYILRNIEHFARSGIKFSMKVLEEKDMTKDLVQNLRGKGINTVPALIYDQDVILQMQILQYLQTILQSLVTNKPRYNPQTYDHEQFLDEQREKMQQELFSGKGSISDDYNDDDPETIKSNMEKYNQERKKRLGEAYNKGNKFTQNNTEQTNRPATVNNQVNLVEAHPPHPPHSSNPEDELDDYMNETIGGTPSPYD